MFPENDTCTFYLLQRLKMYLTSFLMALNGTDSLQVVEITMDEDGAHYSRVQISCVFQ